MTNALKRFADFKGRSSRKDYWLTSLCILGLIIGLIALNLVAAILRTQWLGEMALLLAAAALVFGTIAHLSLTVRRLHDCGRSGKMLILSVPFILVAGAYVIMIWLGLWHGFRSSFSEDPTAFYSALESQKNAPAFFIFQKTPLVLGLKIMAVLMSSYVFIMMFAEGHSGSNRYGPSPIETLATQGAPQYLRATATFAPQKTASASPRSFGRR